MLFLTEKKVEVNDLRKKGPKEGSKSSSKYTESRALWLLDLFTYRLLDLAPRISANFDTALDVCHTEIIEAEVV